MGDGSFVRVGTFVNLKVQLENIVLKTQINYSFVNDVDPYLISLRNLVIAFIISS
jgi:hypothetical protein